MKFDAIEWALGLIFGKDICQPQNSSEEMKTDEEQKPAEQTGENPKPEKPENQKTAHRGDYAGNNFLHRPTGWKDFISDSNQVAVDRLKMSIASAKKRHGILPHILLFGGPGLGKTTIARILANETGAVLKETIGSSISKQIDIYAIFVEIELLQSMGKDVILFVDEIHDITQRDMPETLWYPVLEEGRFHHNLKDSVITINGKDYRIDNTCVDWLRPFTIIGATTDPGMLSAPLRDRFPIACYLKPYSIEDLQKILLGYASRAKVELTEDGALELAMRARGTPRTSINLLTACRDRAVIIGKGIDKEIVEKQMEAMSVDGEGLNEMDVKILQILASAKKGLGLANLAGTSGINKTTISEIIEPLLKQRGYMETTSKRFITDRGLELLTKKGVI